MSRMQGARRKLLRLASHLEALLFRLIDLGYQKIPRLLPRPTIILEGPYAHLGWFQISTDKLRREALKRGQIILSLRVHPPKEADPNNTSSPSRAISASIDIDRAIAYELCIRLEITESEFEKNNHSHMVERSSAQRKAQEIAFHLNQEVRRLRPKNVITIQGHFVETDIINQLANEYSFQVFSLENTIDPNRIICEPATGTAVTYNSSNSYFHSCRNLYPSSKENIAWATSFLQKLQTQKSLEHRSPEASFEWPKGKKRILFLAQCYTDASVLFGADPNVSAVSIVPQLLHYAKENEACIVTKLHPKENTGNTPVGTPYARLTKRRLQPVLLDLESSPEQSRSNFILDYSNRYSTTKLIQDADVVITINSQSGVEALAEGKELILLGDATYGRLGISWNTERPENIKAALNKILRDGMKRNKPEIAALFTRVFFTDFCIEKSAQKIVDAIIKRGTPSPIDQTARIC